MFLKGKIKNLFLVLMSGLWCFPLLAPASEIQLPKFLNDGQSGTSVVLTLVDGIATDLEGNIYISHRSQNRIRKLSPDGIITTIAGNGIAGYDGDGGPAQEASLNFPAGLISLYSVSILDTDDNDKYKIIRRIVGDTIISEDTSP